MAPYVQQCVCQGKAIALAQDLARVQSEAAHCRLQANIMRTWVRTGTDGTTAISIADREDLTIDIADWLKEAARQEKKALRLEIQIAGLPSTGTCVTCGGRGIVTGNGAAAGGMTRKRVTI